MEENIKRARELNILRSRYIDFTTSVEQLANSSLNKYEQIQRVVQQRAGGTDRSELGGSSKSETFGGDSGSCLGIGAETIRALEIELVGGMERDFRQIWSCIREFKPVVIKAQNFKFWIDSVSHELQENASGSIKEQIHPLVESYDSKKEKTENKTQILGIDMERKDGVKSAGLETVNEMENTKVENSKPKKKGKGKKKNKANGNSKDVESNKPAALTVKNAKISTTEKNKENSKDSDFGSLVEYQSVAGIDLELLEKWGKYICELICSEYTRALHLISTVQPSPSSVFNSVADDEENNSISMNSSSGSNISDSFSLVPDFAKKMGHFVKFDSSVAADIRDRLRLVDLIVRYQSVSLN
ncbi:hypothetical protein AYI68_g3222 [Smittium mucronatum]|uniref:Uncharacterized protein n=1 Tax=Smittium mucronatum TaxID=133383 RepID=A0A1R0H0H3_9FUNG|nr:hypothetical protein AYI68_g3222 [Smittium mucronatum]